MIKREFIIKDPYAPEWAFKITTDLEPNKFIEIYKRVEKRFSNYINKYEKEPKRDFYEEVRRKTKATITPYELKVFDVCYF